MEDLEFDEDLEKEIFCRIKDNIYTMNTSIYLQNHLILLRHEVLILLLPISRSWKEHFPCNVECRRWTLELHAYHQQRRMAFISPPVSWLN